MKQGYTSNEVMGLTGITARQLQWWDERRIVVPAREGHRRLYSTEDLAEVAVICELRRRGFSLQRVRKLQMRFAARWLPVVAAMPWACNARVMAGGNGVSRAHTGLAITPVSNNARNVLQLATRANMTLRPRVMGTLFIRPTFMANNSATLSGRQRLTWTAILAS